MKRREFLTRAVPASTLPFLIGGFPFTAYGRSPLLEALVASATESDRVLVLIQLNGGNDGLNTVIPLDQYSAIAAARSNIMIDQTKVLTLTSATGLHPAMTGLQTLYTEQKLAVVQSVGYPNPNFSHFRATDIWLSGADYNEILPTGWMGRFLDEEYPGYPSGYPNTVMPDPLAIQIGSVVTPGLQGPSVSMGLAITNPNSTYILPGGSDVVPSTPAGHELTFIREVAQQTQQYGSSVKTAAGKGQNLSTMYPAAGKNSLADQLKIVAQLISGGLKTRIFVVNLGGFDTHSAQVSTTGGTNTGVHATLLGNLSLAIAAFQDDAHLLGIEDRIVGITFSEFGRRIKSNASNGTDHGTAAPLFVFGSNVNAGVLGQNPVLPAAAGVNDNIAMQFDFRWIYASILKDWFGAAPSALQTALQTPLFDPTGTQPVQLIKQSAVASAGDSQAAPREYQLQQNYPNPFNPSTVIEYTVAQTGNVRLEVFNETGEEVRVLVNAVEPSGHYQVTFNASGLPTGAYFYRLTAGSFVSTKKLLYIK